MTRLIDADALRDKLQAEIDKVNPPFDGVLGSIRCGVRLARNMVEDEPTVDAVKHGHWIKNGDRYCECSVCHHEGNISGQDNYCWFCGAKMEESDE